MPLFSDSILSLMKRHMRAGQGAYDLAALVTAFSDRGGDRSPAMADQVLLSDASFG